MSKVSEVREFFAGAETVECVENTYIPTRAGLRLRLTKVGRSVAAGVQLNGADAGEPFRLVLPTRVGDVVSVDPSSATYILDRKLERLKGHTVTYRLLPEGSGGR